MTRTNPLWDQSITTESPVVERAHNQAVRALHGPPGYSDPILDGPAWRNRLLRVTEAADYMAVSRSKVYALMRAGELPSLTVGGSRRLTVGSVVDYVDRLSEIEG